MGHDFIGFPEDQIGRAMRVPILFDCAEFLTVDKPANANCSALIDRMRSAVANGKFAYLAVESPKEIFPLDDEISGVFFIAKTKESAAKLRNLYGSQTFKFTFEFLTFPSGIGNGISLPCDLPIGKHRTADRMVISSRTGKKAHTEFVFVGNVGTCEHWTAHCPFLRPHQVRIHAHEFGLHLVGEKLYSESKSLNLTKNFRKFDGTAPHWSEEYFPLHLSSVEMEKTLKVTAPVPKKFQSTMKLLEKYQGH